MNVNVKDFSHPKMKMSSSCVLKTSHLKVFSGEIKFDGEGKASPKIVLYWNDDGFVNTYDLGIGLKCNNRCLFTNDRALLPEANAVILEKSLMFVGGPSALPRRYNEKQIFVASRYEPLSKYGNYLGLRQRLAR